MSHSSKKNQAHAKPKAGNATHSATARAINAAPSLITAPIAVAQTRKKATMNPVFIEMTEEASVVMLQTEFENSTAIINPGNERLFPWLSKIAKEFTSFEWEYLRGEYVPNTSTNVTGSIMAVVNGDPDKAPFETDKQILNHEGSTVTSAWNPFVFNMLPKSSATTSKAKFVADVTGLTPEGVGNIFDDIRQVATGVLNFASMGYEALTSTSVADVKVGVDPEPIQAGRFFISYRVKLWGPVDDDVTEDEGVSMFQTTPSASEPYNTFVDQPIEFHPSMGLNPLRIVQVSSSQSYSPVESSALAEAYFTATEPGMYQVHFNMIVDPSAAGLLESEFLQSATITVDPDQGSVILYGPRGRNEPVTHFVKSNDVSIAASTFCGASVDCILILPNPDAWVKVASALVFTETGPATTPWSNSYCSVTFTKINSLISGSLHALKLAKGQKGCLPDVDAANRFVRYRHQQISNLAKTRVANMLLSRAIQGDAGCSPAFVDPCRKPPPTLGSVARGQSDRKENYFPDSKKSLHVVSPPVQLNAATAPAGSTTPKIVTKVVPSVR